MENKLVTKNSDTHECSQCGEIFGESVNYKVKDGKLVLIGFTSYGSCNCGKQFKIELNDNNYNEDYSGEKYND